MLVHSISATLILQQLSPPWRENAGQRTIASALTVAEVIDSATRLLMMEHDNRQKGEPKLEAICPGCGAPDQFYCTCGRSLRPAPLGKHPYKIAISPEELEIAVHHRAATGEPLQTFVRRLIRESAEARSLRRLMTYHDTDVPMTATAPKQGPTPARSSPRC
jgi:hypothetical protein